MWWERRCGMHIHTFRLRGTDLVQAKWLSINRGRQVAGLLGVTCPITVRSVAQVDEGVNTTGEVENRRCNVEVESVDKENGKEKKWKGGGNTERRENRDRGEEDLCYVKFRPNVNCLCWCWIGCCRCFTHQASNISTRHRGSWYM